MKRIASLVAVAISALGLQSSATAAPIGGSSNGVSTIAVYGDAPYGNPTKILPDGTIQVDSSQFNAMPAFFGSINQDPDVGLVAHVGDIHSGKQFCTEPYDQGIQAQFRLLQDPLIYTPGDNEWTDCHKVGEGGHVHINGQPVDYADGDPIANLELVRQLFFATPGQSLGGSPIDVLSQANVVDPSHPTDANY